MIRILLILIVGGIVGYLVRRCRFENVVQTGPLMSWVVAGMLFAFGGGIGENQEIISMLHVLGAQGAILGTAALIGSALSCMLLEGRMSSHGGTACVRRESILPMLKGSLVTVTAFATGLASGYWRWLPEGIDYEMTAEWLLYLLLGIVGFGLGTTSLSRLKPSVGNWRLLAIAPVSVIGTVIAAVLIGLFPGGLTPGDSVITTSGMGYYSLSSMIVDLKAGAIQLGAIALIGNIVRELLALLFAPFIARWLGTYALVGAAGVTSLDVLLPSIRSCCGESAVPVALVNGIMLEVACPFLITVACNYL